MPRSPSSRTPFAFESKNFVPEAEHVRMLSRRGATKSCMFDDSEVDERECIHIDRNAKHLSRNASSRRAARLSAVSPKRAVAIESPGEPPRKLVISALLIAA